MRTSFKTITRHTLDFLELFVIGVGTVGTAMLIMGLVAAFTGGAVGF